MEEKLRRRQHALKATFNMISRHVKRKMSDENEMKSKMKKSGQGIYSKAKKRTKKFD